MTDHYAVIGNPVAQSKSPLIHAAFAKETNQDLDYVPIFGPIGGFAGRVDQFRREGGRGLNVTLPFKLDAFAYATDLSERARTAGAVNALKFDGARAFADNFDGVALVRDIRQNLGFPLAWKRILLLGAGGAARGVIAPLLQERPASFVIANRTPQNGAALAEEFSRFGPVDCLEYVELERALAFDLIVNTTSASLQGEAPPVPARSFAEGSLAYDLVYGKGLTPFLRAARSAGAPHIADGLGMLVEQAADAFEWWRGVRPQTKPVIEALTVPLDSLSSA
jgi:shikimate dehydrogenase